MNNFLLEIDPVIVYLMADIFLITNYLNSMYLIKSDKGSFLWYYLTCRLLSIIIVMIIIFKTMNINAIYQLRIDYCW